MSYIKSAVRTKSDQFHPERVSASEFMVVLRRAIFALNALDQAKKLLFYGKKPTEAFADLEADGSERTFAHRFAVIGDAVLPGGGPQGQIDMIHGIIGKGTESGELLEALYLAFNGTPMDTVNVLEEIGDGFWYDAVICNALNNDEPVSFEAIQSNNIAKLYKRFPDKFTEGHALNRDLDAERGVLETMLHIEPRP